MDYSNFSLNNQNLVRLSKIYSDYILSPYVIAAIAHKSNNKYTRLYKKMSHSPLLVYNYKEHYIEISYVHKAYNDSKVIEDIYYRQRYYLKNNAFHSEVQLNDGSVQILGYTREQEADFKRYLVAIAVKLKHMAKTMEVSELSVRRNKHYSFVEGGNDKVEFTFAFSNRNKLSQQKTTVTYL